MTQKYLFVGAVILSIFVSLLPAPAHAGPPPRSWELGFAAGSANLDSSDEDFDLDLRAEFRGGYTFTEHFQLEAQILRADAVLDAELVAAMANVVFSFRTEGRLSPYALAGAGAFELEDVVFLGLAAPMSDDGLAYQLAFGTRVSFGADEAMALRLELSSLWLHLDLFEQDQFTSLTAGLSWNFGR